MRINEDKEIVDLAAYLYKVNEKWGDQEVWICDKKDSSRGYPKYIDENSVYKMGEIRLINILDDPLLPPDGKVFFNDIKHFRCFKVIFNRKKIIEYLIKVRPLRWGELTIYPNGVFKFKGVKSKELFVLDSQVREFVGYLIYMGEISNDVLCELLEVTVQPSDEVLKKCPEEIEEAINKLKANRIAIIRSQAITELGRMNKKIKKYAKKMFRNKDSGYLLVDYDVIDMKFL